MVFFHYHISVPLCSNPFASGFGVGFGCINTFSQGIWSTRGFQMFHRSEKVRSLKWEKIFEKPHPSNCHHFPFESCMGIHLHIQSSDFRTSRTRWVLDPVISGMTWGPCKWPKIWLLHQMYDWILGPRIV